MATTSIKPLPKKIEDYCRKNITFNMFGLLNLSNLRSFTKTKLSDKELMKRIKKRFSHEFVNNQIEFNGLKEKKRKK